MARGSMGSLRVGYDWATSLSLSVSCIGEGNGNPLQCSCLENPRHGGAWWAAIYGVAQSQARLQWLSSSSSILYSIVTVTIYILTNSARAFPFLHTLFLKLNNLYIWLTIWTLCWPLLLNPSFAGYDHLFKIFLFVPCAFYLCSSVYLLMNTGGSQGKTGKGKKIKW